MRALEYYGPSPSLMREISHARILERNIAIGGSELAVALCPRNLRNEEDVFVLAEIAHRAGARILYAKLQHAQSPAEEHSWRNAFAYVRDRFGLSLAAEVADRTSFDRADACADLLHVALDQAFGQQLLQYLATSRKPIVLECSPAISLEKQITAAEYLISAGNSNVVLCHTGVPDRNPVESLDLRAVPWIHRLARLPVMVRLRLSRVEEATRLALAAVGSGCDGLILEVGSPLGTESADAQAPADCEEFQRLMLEIRQVLPFVNRTLPTPFNWNDPRPGSKEAAALAAELAPGLILEDDVEAAADAQGGAMSSAQV
jgi:3-deoxy-7-phosphoheptulonate synthase